MVTITASHTARAGKEWFQWLCSHCEASGGRGRNLAGMRKQFWGNAYVIRCCGYLFKVGGIEWNYLTH